MDENKHIFSDFTNVYSVSKTLRFALKPVGDTQAKIKDSGLLQVDEERAVKYKQAKKIIDEYHKDFIHERLSSFGFSIDELEQYQDVYTRLKKDRHNEQLKKELETLCKELRGEIAQHLTKDSKLFKKDFIKDILPDWLERPDRELNIEGVEDPKTVIEEFSKWTTYFTGFYENRKNIYTAAQKGTAIAHRVVHENLPRFVDNLARFKGAKELGIDFSSVEERLHVNLEDIFSLAHFNSCLSQQGIDAYNLVRGGRSTSREKEQGINETINLFAQQIAHKLANAADEEKKALKSKIKEVNSCQLEELYKQILFDRTSYSFRLKNLEDDAELCELLSTLFVVKEGDLCGLEDDGALEGYVNISDLIKDALGTRMLGADPQQLYIKNDGSITQISNAIFGNWRIIRDALKYYFSNEKLGKNKRGEAKKLTNAEAEKHLKAPYVSFAEVHAALEYYVDQYQGDVLDERSPDSPEGITQEIISLAGNKPLFSYFKGLEATKSQTATHEKAKLFPNIVAAFKDLSPVLERYGSSKEAELRKEKPDVEIVKKYLDSVQDLLHFLKPLLVESKDLQKDNYFYNGFDKAYQVLKGITKLYNQTRNYLTQKTFSEEKYKLNFENIQLGAGWDKNKESDNTCVILIKEGKYYLGVLDKAHNTLFKNLDVAKISAQIQELQSKKHDKEQEWEGKKDKTTDTSKKLRNEIVAVGKEIIEKERIREYLQDNKNPYSKMVYKFLKDVTTMIPKCSTELNAVREHFRNSAEGYVCTGEVFIEPLTITKEVYELNNLVYDETESKWVPKTKENESRPKKFQKGYLKLSGNERAYKDALRTWIQFCKDFLLRYKSVAEAGYDFGDVFDQEYEGLDTFYKALNDKIYSITYQDVSEGYIDYCVEQGYLYLFEIYSKDFSPRSKGKPNLQTLYWKALFDEENLRDVVYKLDGGIELFYRKASINYPDEIWREGFHANEPQKKQAYPIIKDRRYAVDTFLLHTPITINFKAGKNNNPRVFNNKVNYFLKNNPEVNIIGIDRGERHLAYYTVIDQSGKIIRDKDGKYLQGSLNNPTGKKDYHQLLDEKEQERDKARKSWGTIEKIKDLKAGYLSQVVHKLVTLMVEHGAIIVFEDLNFGFKRGRFKVEKQVYQKLEKMLIDKLNYLILKDKKHTEVGGVLHALQLAAPFESFEKLGKQTGCIFYVPAYHTSKVCPATGFVNLLYPHYETKKKSQDWFRKFSKICYNAEEDLFEFHFDYGKFTDKAKGSKQEWVLYSYGKRLVNFRNPDKNSQWDTKEVCLTAEIKKLFEGFAIDYSSGDNLVATIVKQETSKFFQEFITLIKYMLQLRNSRINSEEDWLISPVKDAQGNFFDSQNADASVPQNADANGAYHIALKGLMLLQQLQGCDDEKDFKADHSNKEWYKFIQSK